MQIMQKHIYSVIIFFIYKYIILIKRNNKILKSDFYKYTEHDLNFTKYIFKFVS